MALKNEPTKKHMTTEERSIDLGLERITYDPLHPELHSFATATAMAAFLRSGPVLPKPVPWPDGLAPVSNAINPAPAPSAPLPHVDVLLVTWTVAEARTMAALMTPGVGLDGWYEYKHNVAAYIPKVTGRKAPFNDPRSPRYYQSLGLYYLCNLGGKLILCFKSGLHMDYDGPDLPIRDLWNQILDETTPDVVITTGTGGGIGADVLLGDVVLAAETVFDCTKQFAGQPFHASSYNTSPVQIAPSALLTASMLKPNADEIAKSDAPLHSNDLPIFFSPGYASMPAPKIVTTDSFEYDNTTDDAGLQALGNVCDMGDASLGLVMQSRSRPPKWIAIRNASDPQIDGSMPRGQQDDAARSYYINFGPYTSANSVLACWSVICQLYSLKPAPPGARMAAIAAAALPASHPPRVIRSMDPNDLLLQVAAGSGFSVSDIRPQDAPPALVSALNVYLKTLNIDAAEGDSDFRSFSFVDEGQRRMELFLVHFSYDGPESFRGTYLFQGTSIVAKVEFTSS